MVLQVPAKTPAQQKIANTVRNEQNRRPIAERAEEILARPNAMTKAGFINPQIVNKEEAGVIAEYRAMQRRPSFFQERKALTGPQGLFQMAKGMGVGGLEAAELWQEEVVKPTTGAVSFAFSPSVREQYRLARERGEDAREAMATAWKKGLTDTPWGLKGAAELLLDPLNLVPVIGFPGAIAKGAKAGAGLGAKAVAPIGREFAEQAAQMPSPSALRPQQAYVMPPEGAPGAGIGAGRTEELGRQAEEARRARGARTRPIEEGEEEFTEVLRQYRKTKAADEYAVNLKLEKYAPETQAVIRRVADEHMDSLLDAKRRKRPEKDTVASARKLIEEQGGDADKIIRKWKPGQAWNAETITALRMGLQSKGQDVFALAKEVAAGANDETKIQLRIRMGELTALQHVVTGVTSEVARATQSLSIKLDDALALGLEGGEAAASVTSKELRNIVESVRGLDDVDLAQAVVDGMKRGEVRSAQKLVTDSFKPTRWDYITELWINGLLSGPKTHVVNAISNSMNTFMAPLEKATAAGVESILAPLQGRERERFFAEAPEYAYGAASGLVDGVRAWLKIVRNGINPAEAAKYDFTKTAFGGVKGRIIRMPGTLLEAADAGHMAINQRAAMNSYVLRLVRKEGLKGDEAIKRMADLRLNPTKAMLKYVEEESKYRLFRNELTGPLKRLQHLRNEFPAMRLILPFLRTPANLVSYGLARSPAALLNHNMWRNIAAKNPEASDQIARAFLGTSVAGALVYVMRGRITGSAPRNPAERDKFFREGKLPYALKFGDTWIQYSRLEPFNQLLSQVAAYHQYMEERENPNELDVAELVVSMADTIGSNLISQTYLSGIADFMEFGSNPAQYAQNYIGRLGGSLITPASAMVRTIAQAQDPVFRRPKGGGPFGIGEALTAGMPDILRGAWGDTGSKTTQPVITAFGEEALRREPGSTLKTFLTLLSPIQFSEAQQSGLDDELGRLGVNVGFASRNIGEVELTPDQYTQYQRMAGQRIYEALQKEIRLESYARRSDIIKASSLETVVTRARADARRDMERILEGKPTRDRTTAPASGRNVSVADLLEMTR